VKPTFKSSGKFKLPGSERVEENTGPSYDFKMQYRVAYDKDKPEGERMEKDEEGYPKKRMFNKDKAQPFSTAVDKNPEGVDDDGF